MSRGLIIAGCSAEKLDTDTPVAALELYQGWCIPRLRELVDTHPALRENILILSGKHGLIDADTPLLPYDQPLTRQRLPLLRDQVCRRLVTEIAHTVECGLVLLLEPLYRELIDPGLLAYPPAVTHWIPAPLEHWDEVLNMVRRWG
jgi:hypothetical protein